MKRLFLQGLLVFLISISFYGCPYQSEVPLSRSEEASIDTELLGIWQPNSLQNDSGFLTIAPFNEHELLVVVHENGGERRDLYRAFVSIVGGVKFLNVQEIDTSMDKKKWSFLNYAIAEDTLTLNFVEDTLFKEPLPSSQDLFEFISTHLDKRTLYTEDGEQILKRSKD